MTSQTNDGDTAEVAASCDSDTQKVDMDSNITKDEDRAVTYQDYSNEPAESDTKSRLPKDPTHTFPMKLHSILSNPEFQDIIAWLPHGRAWRILQHKAFEERVIPLYFRHGRYSSFARQVNGWGFKRITHGPDYNAYYHPRFLRGLVHVSSKMKRLTPQDIKYARNADETLPDFYIFSKDHPLPDLKKAATASVLPVGSAPQVSAAPMLAPGVAMNGINLAALSALLGQQTVVQSPAVAAPAGTTVEQQRNDILRMMGLAAQQPAATGTPAAAPANQANINAILATMGMALAGSNPVPAGQPAPAPSTVRPAPAMPALTIPTMPAGINLAALMTAYQQQQQQAQQQQEQQQQVQPPAAVPAPAINIPGLDLSRLLSMAAPQPAPTPAAPVAAAPPPAAPAPANLGNPLLLLQQLQQQLQNQANGTPVPAPPAAPTPATPAPNPAMALVDALRQVETLKQQLGPNSAGVLAALGLGGTATPAAAVSDTKDVDHSG